VGESRHTSLGLSYSPPDRRVRVRLRLRLQGFGSPSGEHSDRAEFQVRLLEIPDHCDERKQAFKSVSFLFPPDRRLHALPHKTATTARANDCCGERKQAFKPGSFPFPPDRDIDASSLKTTTVGRYQAFSLRLSFPSTPRIICLAVENATTDKSNTRFLRAIKLRDMGLLG
jgi:hypothetical protein